MLSFLNVDADLADFNHTYIVLIQKGNNPQKVSEYRPISLCNVTYKMITKVLPNRLKLILSSVMSPNQCAFMPGRLIIDNSIIAYEILHIMHNHLHGM